MQPVDVDTPFFGETADGQSESVLKSLMTSYAEFLDSMVGSI